MNMDAIFDDIDYDEETPEFGEPDIVDKNEDERVPETETDQTPEIDKEESSDTAFEQLKNNENNFAVDSGMEGQGVALEENKEENKKEVKEEDPPEENTEETTEENTKGEKKESDRKGNTDQPFNISNTADIRTVADDTSKLNKTTDKIKRPKVKIVLDDESTNYEDDSEADTGKDQKAHEVENSDTKDNEKEPEEKISSKIIAFASDQAEKLKNKMESTEYLKKICISAAAIIVILLIPIIFAIVSSKQDIKEKNRSVTQVSTVEPNSKLDTTGFENLLAQKKEETDTDSESNRFDTVDDLTLYIQSSTAFYLSTEKQLYTKYKNGTVGKQDLRESIYDCTEKLNNIYHLLIMNKAVYDENNLSDTYEQLMSNINTVFVYGDSILSY